MTPATHLLSNRPSADAGICNSPAAEHSAAGLRDAQDPKPVGWFPIVAPGATRRTARGPASGRRRALGDHSQ
ncbi:hypothetical protein RHRU231_330020 [Rhodococcus ruber]|uniref:Uncharacterized protein n=1 Tax=Rhodococcus ruber TaxID=1830 RepID=A0A098BFN8_9NOCA|nr:hypothetical protein RHRU231_330020 [Rhodococcus ruber]